MESAPRLSFVDALREQRLDDHRFYHQHRVNQSLHFFSACSFLLAYVLVFVAPVAAALTGWLVAMVSRQIGHFFFEPKGFDHVNDISNGEKEAIKIGYNLKRKRILLSLWAAAPALLYARPELFGQAAPLSRSEFLTTLSQAWLLLAMGAVAFRTAHLFFLYNVQTGLVWAVKIFTDPIHDIILYHSAPGYVLRGELLDPMDDWNG